MSLASLPVAQWCNALLEHERATVRALEKFRWPCELAHLPALLVEEHAVSEHGGGDIGRVETMLDGISAWLAIVRAQTRLSVSRLALRLCGAVDILVLAQCSNRRQTLAAVSISHSGGGGADVPQHRLVCYSRRDPRESLRMQCTASTYIRGALAQQDSPLRALVQLLHVHYTASGAYEWGVCSVDSVLGKAASIGATIGGRLSPHGDPARVIAPLVERFLNNHISISTCIDLFEYADAFASHLLAVLRPSDDQLAPGHFCELSADKRVAVDRELDELRVVMRERAEDVPAAIAFEIVRDVALHISDIQTPYLREATLLAPLAAAGAVQTL